MPLFAAIEAGTIVDSLFVPAIAGPCPCIGPVSGHPPSDVSLLIIAVVVVVVRTAFVAAQCTVLGVFFWVFSTLCFSIGG